MHYEHLVQINDPLMPLLTTVTRGQLWRALALRAEEPRLFMGALDACHIQAREVAEDGAPRLYRQLDFGSFVVSDHATLREPDALEVVTAAGPTWPASRMVIRIEEPEPESLFLRFTVASDQPPETAELEALRRQAYQAADLDMVTRIRELADSGALGK